MGRSVATGIGTLEAPGRNRSRTGLSSYQGAVPHSELRTEEVPGVETTAMHEDGRNRPVGVRSSVSIMRRPRGTRE